MSREEEERITRFANALSGFAYYKDGWIYFSRQGTSYFGDALNVGELYKMKADGTDIIKLADDHAYGIFVENDWVYYVNGTDFRTFYKIKTDGTERQQVNGERRMFESIHIDGWIYFNEYLNEKGRGVGYYGSIGTYQLSVLSRMRIDGTGYQRLMDIELSNFMYHERYLYAAERSYEPKFADNGPVRIDLQSISDETTSKDPISYEVYKDLVIHKNMFVTSDDRIYTDIAGFRSSDGKNYFAEKCALSRETTELVEVNGVGLINLKNGWVYHLTTIRKDGKPITQLSRMDSNKTEVLKEFDFNVAYNIVGDLILYHLPKMVYSSNLDGSDFKPIVDEYTAISNEDKYRAKMLLNDIKGILGYLESEGYFDGEWLRFYNVKDIMNCYLFSGYGVSNEDFDFFDWMICWK